MPFLLTRDGNTSQSLTVPVNVSEIGGDMVDETFKGRFNVEFKAGDAWAKIEVPTNADRDWEEDSTITVILEAGTGYELSSEAGSASSTVKDNDVPAVTAALTMDSSQPQEGEVVTATVTVTTDGPKSLTTMSETWHSDTNWALLNKRTSIFHFAQTTEIFPQAIGSPVVMRLVTTLTTASWLTQPAFP